MTFVDHRIYPERRKCALHSVLLSRVQPGDIMTEELTILPEHREKQRQSTQPLLFDAGILLSQDHWQNNFV